MTSAPGRSTRTAEWPWAVVLLLPLLGLAVLLARPELDLVWEHHPSQFWLVLRTAAASVVLAYLTNEADGAEIGA